MTATAGSGFLAGHRRALLVPTAALLWGTQFAFLNPAIGIILVSLYGASATEVGFALAAYNVSGFVSTLVVPTRADRSGDYLRPLLWCGGFTIALTTALALATTLPLAVLALVALGGPAGIAIGLIFAHQRYTGAGVRQIMRTRAVFSFAWVGGPPFAASGHTCPTMKPWVAPENRPSVTSATSSESPSPTIAAVTCSISRIPGPPTGPSKRITTTSPGLISPAFTAEKVSSLQATPDESFAAANVRVGASVALDHADIFFYMPSYGSRPVPPSLLSKSNANVWITGISPVYETEPVDCPPDSPKFLNAVVLMDTTLAAHRLLDRALAIEDAYDRDRSHGVNAPRTLDVDLIVVGDRRSDTDVLRLPHPQAHERAFVLQPWVDLEPDAQIPGQGPIAVLLEKVGTEGVRRRDDVVLDSQ